MKQTNNAIKFLMAQYRAIFKNANIAMAVALATAALAAGHAQAADLTLGQTADKPSSSQTVSGTVTYSGSKGYTSDIIISGKGNSLSVSGASGHVFVGNSVNVSNSGRLTLSGAHGIIGSFDESFDDKDSVLSVDGGTVNVSGSQIQMNHVVLNNAKVTIGGNIGDNSKSNFADNAQISVLTNPAGGGDLTVSGTSEIKLNNGSLLTAKEYNLEGGTIAMSGGDVTSGSGSVIRAYSDGVVNVSGVTISTSGSGNYITASNINVTAGKLNITAGSALNLVGGVSNQEDISAAKAGVFDITGGTLEIAGDLAVSGKTGNKGSTLTIANGAEVTGSGSITLGEKARLNIDKGIFDTFANGTGNNGKVNFSAAGSQFKFDTTDTVDLSKYTYGSGSGADFDVTQKNVIGKILGDNLAISKGVTGTFTNASGTAIKVEADNLTLGAADAESKLSTIQGDVFTQLTAHDKLTLAGKDNKFTLDKGDMSLTNTDAQTAVIDGAAINVEAGRALIKGAWTSASDIVFTGASLQSSSNFIIGSSGTKFDSSLVLTGTLKNDKNANSWGGIMTDGTSPATNTIDITGATLESTGKENALVLITAQKNGTLAITGAQASDILAAKENTKGFSLRVMSGGTLDIQGELAADFNDFVDHETDASKTVNKITVDAGEGSIKVDKANITGSGDFNLHSAGLEAGELTLADGNLKSGSLTVTSQLNVGKFTVADNGSVSLTGTGSVSGESLTVNGSGASLDVDGSWTVDAGLTTSGSGSVTVDNGSSLSVTGPLNIVDNSVKVTGGSSFKADYAQATGSGSSAGKLDVDATSNFELTNFDAGSITLDELKKQKEAFLGSGDVSGLFSVTGQDGANVAVEGTKAENGKVSFTDAKEAANLAGIYDNVTVVDVNSAVTATNDWGAVQLEAGTNTLSVGKGAIHFNGVAGSDKLVSDSTGAVAGVSLTDSGSALVINGSGKMGDIAASADGNGTVLVNDNVALTTGMIGGNNAVASVTIRDNAVLNATGAVTTKTIDLSDTGAIRAAGQAIKVTDASAATSILGDVEAGSLSLAGGATIAGDANVNLGTLDIAASKTLNVGRDGVDGSSATVFTDKLVMGSGSVIYVDPDYTKAATVLGTMSLTDGTADAGVNVAKGNIYVGKNAAFGIGYDQAGFNAVMGSYLVDGKFVDPALKAGGYANALVLNAPLIVNSGSGIVVDHTLTDAQVAAGTAASGNTLKLGENSVLVITDNAVANGPAITFGQVAQNNGQNVTGAAVSGSSGTVISLVGDFNAKSTDIQLFAAASGATSSNSVTITSTDAKGIKVEALGGLLEGYLTGNSGTLNTLALAADANALAYSGVSRPVGDFFIGLANGDYAIDPAQLGHKFIVNTLKSAGGFQVVDTAAHAATYAGAQQAAVASVTTMADAVVGRVGTLGVEAASISATGSQANGGVWVSPMYKSMDSDGFDAQGASYGSDVDLAGVAFGADTVNGNMRFGAVFNLGSGDADGKGQGNGLKDEFDYYGFGIYSAMGFGNFALVGDASLTVINHDVEGLGLNGEADTSAVTMGVTGQYTIATAMMDVTPHLGARFIRLDTDSYALNSVDGTIANTDFEVQNVFSVPLGVTLSKAFTTGSWSLAPSADLTLTFNTGDTEAESTTTFTGISHGIGMSTEVLDEVQYGLTVGVAAQSGAFGTSFGVNYTGSSNTDSFGVNAQARYVF